MKISILGAGNAGSAVAADLSMKGHEVTLIKTSHSMHDDNYNYLVENNGKMTLNEFGEIKTGYIHKVTRDIEEIRGAEIVVIYIQTRFHELLIERIDPYLEDDQIVLINPGYLSTAYMLKHCPDKKLIIAEAESSFIDGRIMEPDEKSPTLTFNTIARHQSRIVRTRIASNKSPWLALTQVGEVYSVPISHGEGRFLADEETIRALAANGQIATQYVDLEGRVSDDVAFNPNGSLCAVEGITAPDGRVFGKMGHAERIGSNLYKNVPGNYDLRMFEAAVKYFR